MAPMEVVTDVRQLPAAISKWNGRDQLVLGAPNPDGREKVGGSAYKELATYAKKTGHFIVAEFDPRVWNIRPVTADQVGSAIETQSNDRRRDAVELIVPSDASVFDHTGNNRKRFDRLKPGLSMIIQGLDVPRREGAIREIADFKAFVPSAGDKHSFDQIIDVDRNAKWYEWGQWTGTDKTLRKILGSQAIAQYCAKFRDPYLMAAAYGNYWVWMPLKMKGWGGDQAARIKMHAEKADELIFYDPGNDNYDDTTQLGIKDQWFKRGQMQYDVDGDGIETTKVDSARGRKEFSDQGSYNWNGSPASDNDWEWSGPAVQLV